MKLILAFYHVRSETRYKYSGNGCNIVHRVKHLWTMLQTMTLIFTFISESPMPES